MLLDLFIFYKKERLILLVKLKNYIDILNLPVINSSKLPNNNDKRIARILHASVKSKNKNVQKVWRSTIDRSAGSATASEAYPTFTTIC